MPTDLLFLAVAIVIAFALWALHGALEMAATISDRRSFERAMRAKEAKAPAGRGSL